MCSTSKNPCHMFFKNMAREIELLYSSSKFLKDSPLKVLWKIKQIPRGGKGTSKGELQLIMTHYFIKFSWFFLVSKVIERKWQHFDSDMVSNGFTWLLRWYSFIYLCTININILQHFHFDRLLIRSILSEI